MLTILLLTQNDTLAFDFNQLQIAHFEHCKLLTASSISQFLHEYEHQSVGVGVIDCVSIKKTPIEFQQILNQASNKGFSEVVYVVDQNDDGDDIEKLPQANFVSYPFRKVELVSIFRLIKQGKCYLDDEDVQREDNTRYQTITSATNSFILNEVIHNASTGEVNCKVVEANSNFEKNTGLALGELKTKLLNELYSKNTQRRMLEKTSAIDQRIVQFDEYSPKTKRHYRIFAFSPQMNQVAAMLLDISQIKQNQVALEEAIERSKQAETLKTAFIANLSHEIRTPMNSIIGFSGLLESEDIGIEKKQLFAAQIQRSCSSLLSLIEDMLDLSRLQSNQFDLQCKQFPLTAMLHDLQQFTQKKLSDTEKVSDVEVRFERNTLTESIYLKSDKNRLTQVLKILLDNAIKYTEKGSVVLSWQINPHKSIPGLSIIEFSVSDTGIGMKEEVLSVIFEAFTKLELANTARYGGIGVGLTLAKKISMLMDGCLWVESQWGMGSTFRLSLPIAHLVHSDKTKQYPENLALLITKSWDDRTILLVDDEEMNLYFLEELLSPLNARLLYADNGIEAIEMCRKNLDISLVIMDLRMPFMDGYTATSKIKAQFPNLPVIMQTTLSPSDDVASITACGADDFIAKPIDVQSFMQILQRYLE